MATMLIPFAMAVAGALLYALSANPKLAEIGRLLLAAGLFALAFALASAKLSI